MVVDCPSRSKTSQIIEELLTIWKLKAVDTKVKYKNKSVEEYAFEQLDQAEEKVMNNEISENDFIQICSNIKEEKEADTVFTDFCDLKPIGDQRSIQGQPELFIEFSSKNPVENRPQITMEELHEIFHRFRQQPHSSSRLLRIGVFLR